jgi:hypothetical protein
MLGGGAGGAQFVLVWEPAEGDPPWDRLSKDEMACLTAYTMGHPRQMDVEPPPPAR